MTILDASQFVVLEVVGTATGLDFSRTLPDGTSAAGYFRVPEGMVLVVTDVDWQYNSGEPGTRAVLRLLIEPLATDERETPRAPGRRVFASTITQLNPEGDGGRSEAMTTGFAVSSAGKLAVDVMGKGGKLNHLVIRGYLILA